MKKFRKVSRLASWSVRKFRVTCQSLQPHLDPSLQLPWNLAQLGLFIFPLFPALGAVGLFLALAGTWNVKFRKILNRPLNWGLAIVSVWLVLSAVFAFNRSEAFLGLANFLPFFILFAAFSELIQTPTQLRRLAWILVIPAVPVVILGFGQLFWGWQSPVLVQSILGWQLAAKGNPVGRIASVFMYANILAAYLQLMFILGLGLWIEAYQTLFIARSSEKIALHNPREKDLLDLPPRMHHPSLLRKIGGDQRLRFVFLSVAVMGSAAALILTNSRNAWAIVILSCLAFAFYQGWRWLIAASAGIAASVFWAAFGPSPVREWLRGIIPSYFWARLTDQLYPDRPVALLRTTQWQFAAWMTQQRPWTGWGLRNFSPLYQAKMNLWLGHPHSLLLMLTAEAGIPTTLLFCSLVSWVLAQGVLLFLSWPAEEHPDKLILFSYLVAFLALTLFNSVDVTLFDLRVNTLGWVLFAAISGVVYQGKSNHQTLPLLS